MKPIVVMKFGGSSVKDAERVMRAAAEIVSTKKRGNSVDRTKKRRREKREIQS